jgi:hypothetical protein
MEDISDLILPDSRLPQRRHADSEMMPKNGDKIHYLKPIILGIGSF